MIDRNWLAKDRSAIRLDISQTIAQKYRARTNLKMDAVIPPGLTKSWFEEEYEVRPQARKLAYVGRLEANKGLHDLINIFHALNQELPDLELRLIGDGPMREWLLQERDRLGLNDKLILTGPLPRERVCDELIRIDIFLFP